MASTSGSVAAAEEGLDRGGERVVRVMDEHVALADDDEEIGRLAVDRRQPMVGHPGEGRPLEIGSDKGVSDNSPAMSSGALDRVDVLGPDCISRISRSACSGIPGSTSSRTTRAEPPPRQLDSIAASRSWASSSSISKSALRVTRKGWWATISTPGEQRVEMGGDHLLERHEPLVRRRHHEARQDRRDLDPGEPGHPGRGSRTNTARLSERLEM